MQYFMSRKNVDSYIEIMKEYDNSYIINEINKVLPKSSSLLELGMGTGIDLISLSMNYKVVGSDNSHFFVQDFKSKSDLEVMVLDAVDININRCFDCIYSNKVLHYLSKEDFVKSLKNQSYHLTTNGMIFATLWVGEYREEFEFDGQLRFVYYDEETLRNLIPNELQLEKLIYYSELEPNDSLIIILRRKQL